MTKSCRIFCLIALSFIPAISNASLCSIKNISSAWNPLEKGIQIVMTNSGRSVSYDDLLRDDLTRPVEDASNCDMYAPDCPYVKSFEDTACHKAVERLKQLSGSNICAVDWVLVYKSCADYEKNYGTSNYLHPYPVTEIPRGQ